jgi:hypothetical protein
MYTKSSLPKNTKKTHKVEPINATDPVITRSHRQKISDRTPHSLSL